MTCLYFPIHFRGQTQTRTINWFHVIKNTPPPLHLNNEKINPRSKYSLKPNWWADVMLDKRLATSLVNAGSYIYVLFWSVIKNAWQKEQLKSFVDRTTSSQINWFFPSIFRYRGNISLWKALLIVSTVERIYDCYSSKPSSERLHCIDLYISGISGLFSHYILK